VPRVRLTRVVLFTLGIRLISVVRVTSVVLISVVRLTRVVLFTLGIRLISVVGVTRLTRVVSVVIVVSIIGFLALFWLLLAPACIQVGKSD
jgi:hypothetical protein